MQINVPKHDCNATNGSLKRLTEKRQKPKGTKEGESVLKEDRRREVNMFPLVLSPHVSDSPMDDLW